jgi:hypothetical protein
MPPKADWIAPPSMSGGSKVLVGMTTQDAEATATGDTNWHDKGTPVSITTTVTCTITAILQSDLKISNASYHSYLALNNGSTDIILLGTTSTAYIGKGKGYLVTGQPAGTYTFHLHMKTDNATATAYISGATAIIQATPE